MSWSGATRVVYNMAKYIKNYILRCMGTCMQRRASSKGSNGNRVKGGNAWQARSTAGATTRTLSTSAHRLAPSPASNGSSAASTRSNNMQPGRLVSLILPVRRDVMFATFLSAFSAASPS